MVTLRNILLLSATILVTLIYGCSDFGVTPQKHTSTFPLTAGSRWQYNRISWSVSFSDSTPEYVDTTEIFRHVIGQDSLAELMHWIAIDDSFIVLGGESDTYEQRQWFGIQDGRLKIYAHQFSRHGQTNDIEFYPQPYIMLDFPLDEGKSWQSYDSLIGGWERTVLGSETIIAVGHQFKCDIVGTRSSDDWEHPDDYHYKEWYSDDGLISSSFAAMEYIQDEHGAIIDSVQAFQKVELLDINIVGAID